EPACGAAVLRRADRGGNRPDAGNLRADRKARLGQGPRLPLLYPARPGRGMKPDLPADPEGWGQIEALLDEMFERPAEERRAFLDKACAGNPELRAQMEALRIAHEKAGGFLATPAHRAAVELLADTAGESASLADRELGPYRLGREIGSGGMSVVYAAGGTRLQRPEAVQRPF